MVNDAAKNVRQVYLAGLYEIKDAVLTEAIDTTTSGGKLVFHLFAALAEFERTLIRERTRAGLKAARARGRQGGRPMSLSADKRRMAQALRDDPKQSVSSTCKALGITRTTFYRYTTASNGGSRINEGKEQETDT